MKTLLFTFWLTAFWLLVLAGPTDGLTFEKKYIFSRRERQYVEFVDKCHYHQTSPKSIFTRKKINYYKREINFGTGTRTENYLKVI